MRTRNIARLGAALVVAAFLGRGFLGGRLQGSPAAALAAPTPDRHAAPIAVAALGRVQPKGGVIRVAGPSQPSVVIGRLLVEEGDRVEAGQPLAVLDDYNLRHAEVERLRAAVEQAQPERKPWKGSLRGRIKPATAREAREGGLGTLFAELERARAELARATVRSPATGTVLRVHARDGEKVGPQGIVELGQTDEMKVVAEVYETDVPRVQIGQHAVVSSPTIDGALAGTVTKIGRVVGKREVLGLDPADQTDARVVEVEVRLDDGGRVAALTNLQVEVAIRP